MARALSASFAAALFAIVVAGASGALAASPAEAEAAAEPTAAPTAARASARATMSTFLHAMVAAATERDAGHLADAVACLDLSGLPAASRGEAGRELAIKLKEIVDRIRLVVYDDIPDAAAGPAYVFHRDRETGVAVIIDRAESGEWLFTRETVAGIDRLYRALEGTAKVVGAGDSPASLSASYWLRSKMPDELKRVGFLMEHWQWLALFVLVLVGALGARLLRRVLFRPVERWLEKRDFGVPAHLLVNVLRPTGFIAMAVVWVVGLAWVGLEPDLNALFIVIVKFLAACGVVWFAYQVINVVSHVLGRRAAATAGRFDDLLVPFFRKSAKIVVTAVGVVFIADVVGISPASLLAGIGLGGLAVALAAQDTVKNFFGSLTVLLDRPFEVGDAVNIGGNTEGVVEEVGFRSTRIRTYDHTLITLPNANLIAAKVDNLGRRTFRRLRTTIGITYDTPPDKIRAFCEGLRELIRQHPDTRKDNFAVYFTGLGASALEILFQAHFTTPAYAPAATAQHELLLDVVTLANRLGVAFAFPTQTVVVQRAEDATAMAYPLTDTAAAERDHALGREEAARIAQARAPASDLAAP